MMNAFSDSDKETDGNAFSVKKPITKAMHKSFMASPYETIEDYLIAKGLNPKKYDVEAYEAEHGEMKEEMDD